MERWFTLKVFQTLEQADLTHQFLAQNGIDSKMEPDEAGVKILVSDLNLSKAQELLQLG